MNKQTKVYLQYPWKFPDSPYYKYLVESPPWGIEYLNAEKQKGVITHYRKFWILTRLKINIRKCINSLKLNIPNAWKTKSSEDYDLIHCAHCLSKNKNKPWVADIESYWSMFLGNSSSKKNKKKVLEYLKRENCKRIMPWTEFSEKEIIENFPEIKDKVELVYPAVPLKINKKKSNGNKITILYATRHFWLKGGIIALEVYKKLNDKYGDKIELIFISDVPEEVRVKYPKINISGLVNHKELIRLYKKSDLFFYPSFVDTFGFGLLEAMSYGLPSVTLDTPYTYSLREIISNGKTGVVYGVDRAKMLEAINTRKDLIIRKYKNIIDSLFEGCCKLIENKKMLQKMSKNCIEEIKNGKFSIKERNKKLKRIYEDTIK